MTRTARRAAALALAVVGVAVTQLPAVRPADAVESVEHITTPSTRTVAWTDQNPRDPGDRVPAVYDSLKDLKLRVSQTQDLLNQTVEVSWEGGASKGNGTFLQLMQCWSDGPTTPPTREQCAYGGIDREGSNGSGSARTRALGADPREKTYRFDGDLSPVMVNGASPGATWAGDDQVVFGTSSPQAVCPTAAVGYTVSLVPSRDTGLSPLVVEGPTSTMPASLTRKVGSFTRTYPAVTAPIVLSKVAAAQGLSRLPAGSYRVQLACDGPAGTPLMSLFLTWIQTTSAGVWSKKSHEGGVFVPFDPLGDTADDAPTDPYERAQLFDYVKPRSTNEIWQAKDDPSGGGDVFMEMLTDLEAPHLGCGRVDSGVPRTCWLVAVPRWAGDPDGNPLYLPTAASPLSETLWDRRIAVPLGFAPVAAGCKIGSGLKQVIADDIALSALRSWQPEFCQDSSTASSILGPLPDFSIRAGFAKPNRMGVTGVPDVGTSPTVVTAPIATSGVVVGFSVDRQIPYGADGYDLDGTRVTTMNLNPRLLAKLLTQSYDSGAAPNGGKTTGYNSSVFSGGFVPTFTPARNFPTGNPRRLYDDPEFLRLNPDIAGWLAKGATLPPQDLADVLVAASDTDAYHEVWQYVLGDPDARAFLAGTPDPDGMRVNPYYQGQITSDLSTFPQYDPTCADLIQDPAGKDFPLLCQPNDHPRVEDDTQAAQSAVRGDTKRNNVIPIIFGPAITSYGAEPRQDQGRHGMLVITNAAVAQRYGLPTARLRNADGNYVGATAESMSAARDQMAQRSDGVLVPDPAKVGGDGYPLTTMSYAQVDVAATTQGQDDAFAAMLDYAAGDGQQPGLALGQLPPGYAPLTTELAAQTASAAKVLRDPSALLSPTAPEQVAGSPSPPAPTEPASPRVPLPAAPPVVPVVAVPTHPRPTSAPPRVAVPASVTASPTSPLRFALPGLLLGALLAGVSGRVLTTVGRTRS